MLRSVLLTLGIVLMLGGVVGLGLGAVYALPPLILGGVLSLGILVERIFYKPLVSAPPGQGWIHTEERFVDPDTGKTVDVFYNPATGERQYVDRGQAGHRP